LALTLIEEHTRTLRLFENGILRGIFLPNREDVARGFGDCTVRSFIKSTLHQILLG
jgi:hypothetical protein